MQNQLFASLKQVLRENDYYPNGDRWGAAMALFFDVAAFVYEENDVPIEWQYRPGAMGNQIDTESYNYDWLNTLAPEDRLSIGEYLHRLTSRLQLAGISY